MGGGTLDVSILKIVDGDIKVLSTNGDTHLGGQDMDVLLMQHCMRDFKEKSDIDIS